MAYSFFFNRFKRIINFQVKVIDISSLINMYIRIRENVKCIKKKVCF